MHLPSSKRVRLIGSSPTFATYQVLEAHPLISILGIGTEEMAGSPIIVVSNRILQGLDKCYVQCRIVGGGSLIWRLQ